MAEIKLNWTRGEWETPDGKKVPYYEADLMHLFEDMYAPGAIVYGLNIRRWPRNTTVKLAIDDSPDEFDEYTGPDGNGDGLISGYSHVTLHTVLTLPTVEFDANVGAALVMVQEALAEMGFSHDR